MPDSLTPLRERIEYLQRRLEALRHDLREYGRHIAPCPLSRQPTLFRDACTCGFTKALAREPLDG